MSLSTLFARVVNGFWTFLTMVVVTAFSLMLTVMAIQVISRYTLGIAVPWTDEASRYLFLLEIFLGSVLALRHKEHIIVTVIIDLLPTVARRILSIISDFLSILVLLMLMSGAWDMMERTAGVLASTFQMSFSYLYLMQFLSAFLMVLVLANDLQRHLRGKPAGSTQHSES